jgi:glycosyltransferase involved in cell wall biosynthesis
LGYPDARSAVIPHPITFPNAGLTKAEARQSLGLPATAHIVICAAAWNRHHKRIDHLINEAAASGRPDLHLLLCGQPEAETAGLKILGAQKLPGRCTWLTLPAKDMPKAYAAADWFVLPSLSEGLGAVLIEAAAAGLGVYAHRMPPAQFILGEDYPGLIDMAKPGILADRLREQDIHFNTQMIAEIGSLAKSRFSSFPLARKLLDFITAETV